MRMADRVDRTQRESKPAGVAVATFKKFSEDRSTNLASMIAFWGIFSIFRCSWSWSPFWRGFCPRRTSTRYSARSRRCCRCSIRRRSAALPAACWRSSRVGHALWSGLGVVRTVQFAFDSVWEIPYHQRPGMVQQTLRSVWVLGTIGVGLVLTTLISGFVVTSANGVHLGVLGRVGGYVLAAALDVGIFWPRSGFSRREPRPCATCCRAPCFPEWRSSSFSRCRPDHFPLPAKAESTYGHFATVITILRWFYLRKHHVARRAVERRTERARTRH